MTHGFMAEERRGWDLLGSVDDVKVKAAEQMKALTFAMELADAALSAACTFKSTAVAAKAAKVAEAAMAEREEKRMEKLRQRAADKQAKAEAKARAKEDKKAASEAAKKAQEEQGEVAEGDGVAEGQEEPRTRRGKGLHELGEEDPSILRVKVPGAECCLTEATEDFCNEIFAYKPCILRLHRSVMKKVMEKHLEADGNDPSKKVINSIVNRMKTQIESFTSDFAEKCEAGRYYYIIYRRVGGQRSVTGSLRASRFFTSFQSFKSMTYTRFTIEVRGTPGSRSRFTRSMYSVALRLFDHGLHAVSFWRAPFRCVDSSL